VSSALTSRTLHFCPYGIFVQFIYYDSRNNEQLFKQRERIVPCSGDAVLLL